MKKSRFLLIPALVALALLPAAFVKTGARRAEADLAAAEAMLPMLRAAWEADAIRAAEARRASDESTDPEMEAAAIRWEGIAAASRGRMESAHRTAEAARAAARELHIEAGTIPAEVARRHGEAVGLAVDLRAADAALRAAEAEAADCERKYDRALRVRASRPEIPARRRALHAARDRVEQLARSRDDVAARLAESRDIRP